MECNTVESLNPHTNYYSYLAKNMVFCDYPEDGGSNSSVMFLTLHGLGTRISNPVYWTTSCLVRNSDIDRRFGYVTALFQEVMWHQRMLKNGKNFEYGSRGLFGRDLSAFVQTTKTSEGSEEPVTHE